jgi:hypothetical protein
LNTTSGNIDDTGTIVGDGSFLANTLVNVEFSGFGNEVVFEITNNTYSAGDTIIFENLFVDYIDNAGIYEIIESYDSNIKIGLTINSTSTISLSDATIFDMIESRYQYENGQFNQNDYALNTFALAANINATDQSLTLVSTKNLKAPGLIQIDDEFITYQTINGNTLQGLGRGTNGTHNVAHTANTTVTRLKNMYVYLDSANSSDFNTIGSSNLARWAVKGNVNNTGWNLIRTQNLKVDTLEFKNAVIFDNADNYALSHLQAYDPAKNLFPGQVAAEVTYKLDVDPASYSNNLWGVGQVGQVWWNTQNLVYENYEISNDTYRANNWGSLTPFSSVDVYEWVESNVLPSGWSSSTSASDYYTSTNGEPYQDGDGNYPYVTGTKLSSTGQTKTVYYFWVKNLSSNPEFVGRNYSVFEIANIIRDPTSEGIVWFAPSSQSSLIVANLSTMALNDETSIQISYNNQTSLDDGHSQWLLVREGDEVSLPPDSFWTQMKTSMSGFNSVYQPVPDMNVDPINRYGNMKRPRQSWFIDQNKATQEFF